MGLIFCMFVHIAIMNNHTKFRVNRKTLRYIFRRGHFDPPPAFSWASETSPLRGLRVDALLLKNLVTHFTHASNVFRILKYASLALQIQGVWQNCTHFFYLNFLASKGSRNSIFNIFRQLFPCTGCLRCFQLNGSWTGKKISSR